jgi:Fibronectin type III domain
MGTPPTVPTAVSARARSGSAFVFWNPSNALGSEISSYTITAQPGGKTVTTASFPWEAEVTGLNNGTTYRFTVTANNGFGAGPTSASASATPKMTTNIFAAGDIGGDGRNDIEALRPTSAPTGLDRSAYLYLGNGKGRIQRNDASARPVSGK